MLTEGTVAADSMQRVASDRQTVQKQTQALVRLLPGENRSEGQVNNQQSASNFPLFSYFVTFKNRYICYIMVEPF